MKFNVLTIFPKMFQRAYEDGNGVVAKSVLKGDVVVNPVNIRDFANDKHHTTDDYPYGGGHGLVMKVEPVVLAVESIAQGERTRTVMLDPRGRVFTAEVAQGYAKLLTEGAYDSITFVCGRYEGLDERAYDLVVDESLSLGDFILTGGELAAMVAIESIARYKRGVLGDEMSAEYDSFSNNMLEQPHYTRPWEFRGLAVPDVLKSGNPVLIDAWRSERQVSVTKARRPDLIRSNGRNLVSKLDIYVGLMHYPMVDKCGDIVGTSLTNMDIHDISRSCMTFDVSRYFIVNPQASQQEIALRVTKHWQQGAGLAYNSNRSEAFERTSVVSSLFECIAHIRTKTGRNPLIVLTTARGNYDFKEPYEVVCDAHDADAPVLLLFGTGWGFHEAVFEMADAVVSPINGRGNYNHLSVRSAVAIMLDRFINF